MKIGFVSDEARNNVRVFDTSRQLILASFSGPGSGEGQFNYVSSIEVADDRHECGPTDSNNHRIQRENSPPKGLFFWSRM